MLARFLFIPLGFMVGCSTMTVDPIECEGHQICQEAFGFGSVCGDEGLCAPVESQARCSLLPDDLTFPVSRESHHVMGSIFDHSLDTHVARAQAVQLALSQAESLEEREFAVIACDNQENADLDADNQDEATLKVAEWLAVDVGVHAIVGPSASSRAELVYSAIAEQEDVLVISPSATSTTLTTIDGEGSTEASPGLFWRTVGPDDIQAVEIARDMTTQFDPGQLRVFRSRASESVGVIYRAGPYGTGLFDGFTEEFVSLGGQVQGFPFDGDASRAEAIANAANGPFDEFLFVSSNLDDNLAFLQAADSLPALAEVPLFVPDAARNTDVLQGGVDYAAVFPRLRASAPSTPRGAVNDTFVVAYGAEFDGNVAQDSFAAHSFDAGWLVLYAHAWAARGSTFSGTDLARGMRQLSAGPTLPIQPGSWEEVQNVFRQGGSVNVEGASGSLDFDEEGETTSEILVWVVDSEELVFVEAP